MKKNFLTLIPFIMAVLIALIFKGLDHFSLFCSLTIAGIFVLPFRMILSLSGVGEDSEDILG